MRRQLQHSATDVGLNPLQLQILKFVDFKKSQQITVRFLADEMEVTEATISDSLRSLENRSLIQKTSDSIDKRIRYISITSGGKKILNQAGSHEMEIFDNLSESTLEKVAVGLHEIIRHIFSEDKLKHARICMTCKFFSANASNESRYCNLLRKKISVRDLQYDCDEHQCIDRKS